MATATRTRSSTRWVDRLEKKLPPAVRTVFERSRNQDMLLFASGLAFYALVSIVPLAIFSIWIVSLVIGDQRVHQVAQEFKRAAPQNLQVGHFIERISELGTSIGAVALLTALWPATSYGAGLRRAFDRLAEKQQRELKGLKGRGLALIVLLPLFVIGSLLASYVGTALFGNSAWEQVLGIGLGLVMGFGVTAVGVGLIYWIFPPERMPFRQIAKGTLWSASTISLLSLGFTLFLNLGANFEEHYGTSGIAAIVLLGVWLFLSNALLLVGYRIALDVKR